MKKYIVILSSILIALMILQVPMFERLTISNGKTKKIVYIENINNAKEFVVSFRHSVNRTPVNEFIKIQGRHFIVYKTTFFSYGAGMPEYDPKSGEQVKISNGLVEIDNMNRRLDSFTYLVGTYADHELSYGNKSMKLSDFVPKQNPAFFSIERVSPMKLMEFKLRGI